MADSFWPYAWIPTLNVAWPGRKDRAGARSLFRKIEYRRKRLIQELPMSYHQTDRDRRKKAVDRSVSFWIFEMHTEKKSGLILKIRRPEQKFDGIDALKKTDR